MNDRIQQLRTSLHAWNHAYYVAHAPTVTDAEYDAALHELIALETAHPEESDPTSPTQRVGSDLSAGFVKAKHAQPMLSLGNTFTASEVCAFFGRLQCELIAEWKIDGLSCSLVYRNGKLIRAVTRGDGTTGDDVTANVRTIRTVPMVLKHAVDVEVRGEVYMLRPVFDRLNRERAEAGDELFANPRNAASGTLKQRSSKTVAERQLNFVAYQSFWTSEGKSLAPSSSQLIMLEDLRTLGFVTTLDLKGSVRHFDESGVAAEISRRTTERDLLDFDVDGIVFKVDSRSVQEVLGTGNKSPKWAVAFKFPPERKSTTLLSVTVQVGRTGVLTPVAELKPLHLAGSTVRRASLCNQDEVERLGINVGAEVFVEKAAEIIPKVVGVVHPGSSCWKMPETCPCCGIKVERHGVHYFCPNADCRDQVVERLKHATAKPALDWDGMGDAQVQLLVSAGFTKLSDLLNPEIPACVTGAARSKFAVEREKVKLAPLWRKLHSLGIELVGSTMCKEIASRWASLEEILNHQSEVRSLLGPVKGDNFFNGLVQLADEIEALDLLGFKFEEERQVGPLTGKTLCITGTLMSGSREVVSGRIEKAGGIVKGSVGKSTNYLVIGEAPGGNKTAAAKKYGTTVLNEEQLYALIGIPMPVVQTDASEHNY